MGIKLSVNKLPNGNISLIGSATTNSIFDIIDNDKLRQTIIGMILPNLEPLIIKHIDKKDNGEHQVRPEVFTLLNQLGIQCNLNRVIGKITGEFEIIISNLVHYDKLMTLIKLTNTSLRKDFLIEYNNH